MNWIYLFCLMCLQLLEQISKMEILNKVLESILYIILKHTVHAILVLCSKKLFHVQPLQKQNHVKCPYINSCRCSELNCLCLLLISYGAP